MAAPPVPGEFRGSGAVHCCGHHKERCHFGRQHTWSTWFKDGRLQRTGTTFHCFDCGGVCTGEEPDWASSDKAAFPLAAACEPVSP